MVKGMNLYRIIALLTLLLAHSLPAGALAVSAGHSQQSCAMACCAELEADGMAHCLCSASSQQPQKPMPASTSQSGIQERLPAVAWEIQRGLERPFTLVAQGAATALQTDLVVHSPTVELPVLFCTFLI